MWSAFTELTESQPMRAWFAQNVRFGPGKVYTREGVAIAPHFPANSPPLGTSVTTMYNWLRASGNFVLYADQNLSVNITTVGVGGQTNLFFLIPHFRGFTVAEAGQRAYLAFFLEGTPFGAGQVRITDGSTQNDVAFSKPLLVFPSYTATITDPAFGVTTVGLHFFAFVYQSRTGFNGKPSPINPTGEFTGGIPFLISGAPRVIRITLTFDTPSDAGPGSAVYVIMTRADNFNKWYYVPGCFIVPPASTAGYTVTFPDINIADEDLAARAESADDQFNVLSQDVSGNGPFNPNVVLNYRHRNVYVVNDKAYVSDIDDFQSVSEDQHVIQGPGQRSIYAAFPFGQSLYLVGDHWIAQTTDNGDLPVLWPQPQEISAMGTTAPLGVCWRTAGPYVWVACKDGLRLFRGTFDPIPVTYLFDQWKFVHWPMAYTIQVVDDISARKVYVAVPLYPGFGPFPTEPTHTVVVDYTAGLGYNEVDISIDKYRTDTFSSLCVVKTVEQRNNVWIGPTEFNSLKYYDQTAVADDGPAGPGTFPIHAIWHSGYLRNGPNENNIPSHFMRLGNLAMGVSGLGTLAQTWYGTDQQVIRSPAALPLGPNPGRDLFTKCDLNPVENVSIRLETNTAGSYFLLTGLTLYCKPSMFNP